jgi:predicted nucleic acid-binding protein
VIAIADSSLIILLTRIGRTDLLRDLFTEVIIPRAVHEEIGAGGSRPGAAELAAASWITVRSVMDQTGVQALLGELGRGEAEVIVLAEELGKPATVLLDDAAGRRVARQRGLPVLGSAGVLVQGKERGLHPLVRPVLDEVRAAGLYLSDTLYQRLLAGIGEAPVDLPSRDHE